MKQARDRKKKGSEVQKQLYQYITIMRTTYSQKK